MSKDEETPEITMDDVVYFMGWHIDSQRRIYDCMLALIASLGENEKAKQLQSMHERGQFLYPPPWAQPKKDVPDDIDDVDPADTHEMYRR